MQRALHSLHPLFQKQTIAFVPERIRTELFEVTGHPFLSHVIAGKGIPEASQTRETGFFSTMLMFSGTRRSPAILGGTTEE